eukprot:GHVP01027189.1.p1 GENE.GHVP01027189.1~~GHVP01027189.1.p1  ORF type:complete len:428 (+),score=98.89 GHVP01027189.1:1125-2408(+)
MSNVYAKEPPTNGLVKLHTSFGILELLLWSKECPKACRNFLQLCLERYYDGSSFFRIIKKSLVQTGDPSGTGNGFESIYDGEAYALELHQRLKFRHRGLCGIACKPGDVNSNGSQFFITLDQAEYLNGKNTLFAKVSMNSFYHLLQMLEEIETDSEDRPTSDQIPRILWTEVVECPFDDILPRQDKVKPLKFPEELHVEEVESKKSGNKKIKLSFEDEDDFEEDLKECEVLNFSGIRSLHDVIDGQTIVKKTPEDAEIQIEKKSKSNVMQRHKTEDREELEDFEYEQIVDHSVDNKTSALEEEIKKLRSDVVDLKIKERDAIRPKKQLLEEETKQLSSLEKTRRMFQEKSNINKMRKIDTVDAMKSFVESYKERRDCHKPNEEQQTKLQHFDLASAQESNWMVVEGGLKFWVDSSNAYDNERETPQQ